MSPQNDKYAITEEQNPSEFLEAKMQTKNYSRETIDGYTRILTTLEKRGANLNSPQSVEETLTSQKWADGTKQNATNAVLLYWKFLGIKAELTTYKQQDKIPFIPTENELDQLISGTRHQLATFLQTLKETATRYGEALNLKWIDYDTEQATLSITPEKGSNPRRIKISTKLQTMLSQLPKTTEKIFTYKDKNSLRKNFQVARKRIAKNTGNPRMSQIHFHTFRHWKATTEFHKTNNVIMVMKLLGHKCLNNTQRYIQLLPELSDNFVCEKATNINEAMKLIESGFEYVTEMDGIKIFKKRK